MFLGFPGVVGMGGSFEVFFLLWGGSVIATAVGIEVPGEDIVGNSGNVILIAEGVAKGEHESSLARTDGTRDGIVLMLILVFYDRMEE